MQFKDLILELKNMTLSNYNIKILNLIDDKLYFDDEILNKNQVYYCKIIIEDKIYKILSTKNVKDLKKILKVKDTFSIYHILKEPCEMDVGDITLKYGKIGKLLYDDLPLYKQNIKEIAHCLVVQYSSP